MQLLKSRKNAFLPLPQRESFDCMEGPVSDEEQVQNAAWNRPETVSSAMSLLTSELVKHLRGLPGNSTLFALKSDKLFG